MIELNEKLTCQVAHLARLELTPLEVKVFTIQLNEIIQYVEKLQDVDVQGVVPLVHPFDGIAFLREDDIKESLLGLDGKPKILQSAQDIFEDSFKVPSIF